MASAAVQQPTGHTTSFEPLIASHNEAPSKPHDVKTTLNYYKDPGDGSEPHPSYIGKPETYERPSEPLEVTVHDVRGTEQNYHLDKQGFQFYTHASVESAFDDDNRIKAIYYPETEQLLKEATGATRVHIFDHTIRRDPKDVRPSTGEPQKPAPQSARGPVTRVHIDQSYPAARARVPYHLPDDADALLQSRHQIINVWRPIRKILKDPLAVANAHSVPESDLVPVALIYPDRRGETLTVRPNRAHEWFFLYGQETDEVTLIKCFDSKVDGRARRVPHTAFKDGGHEGSYDRESIEVRALVFHEGEGAE